MKRCKSENDVRTPQKPSFFLLKTSSFHKTCSNKTKDKDATIESFINLIINNEEFIKDLKGIMYVSPYEKIDTFKEELKDSLGEMNDEALAVLLDAAKQNKNIEKKLTDILHREEGFPGYWKSQLDNICNAIYKKTFENEIDDYLESNPDINIESEEIDEKLKSFTPQ